MENIYFDEMKPCFFREGRITYLRPLMRSDLRPEYLAWLNNPGLTKYSARFRTWPTTEKDLDDFYGSNLKSNNHVVFAACCKKTGIHFGNVSIDDIDWVNRNAHLNVMIGIPEFRVVHYLDVMKVLMKYSFDTLNLNKLCGGAEIPGILDLHKRMGWKKEGVLRKHFLRDGKYVDVVLFAILREEYLKLK